MGEESDSQVMVALAPTSTNCSGGLNLEESEESIAVKIKCFQQLVEIHKPVHHELNFVLYCRLNRFT